MLKYEGIAKVGDKIRAFDFEPLYPRPNRYIEGIVTRIIDDKDPAFSRVGYFAYQVKVTKDTLNEDVYSRIGLHSLVPMETTMDYIGRITNIS